MKLGNLKTDWVKNSKVTNVSKNKMHAITCRYPYKTSEVEMPKFKNSP